MRNGLKELRERSASELAKREHELFDQLFKIRFQVATGQSENPGRIRSVRRELAQVKTLRRELQLGLAAKR